MNRKQKEFTKIFIFLYLAAFIVFNWNDVSWVFNYKVVGALASDFFNPYQNKQSVVLASDQNISDLNKLVTQSDPVPIKKEFPRTDRENSLEIPSLGMITPLVAGQSTDIATLTKELNSGVVYYPGSVAPGTTGQMVVLGHSAPPNWPHIKYDWVFSNIQDLKAGDQIIVYFDKRIYTYTVTTKTIIDPGQDITSHNQDGTKNILTIVSCWPPGKDYKRITVEAELVVN